jgi:aminopeptidase N
VRRVLLQLIRCSYSLEPVPIPSYLLAIASGNVRYRPFPQFEDKQWRTGIWAEPELIDAAYWEFSEDTARCVAAFFLPYPRLKPTCRFLAAEENIVTPYKFGVYDLLVLPPSFPYGGMVSWPRTLGLPNNHLCVGKRVPVVLDAKYDPWPISAP